MCQIILPDPVFCEWLTTHKLLRITSPVLSQIGSLTMFLFADAYLCFVKQLADINMRSS